MAETTEDHLQSWVGRQEETVDTLAPEQALRMAALLDLEQPPAIGQGLPQLWHWAYFAPHARQSKIGVDGHPERGDFLPPIELPRRMWAGSRVKFLQPLLVGQNVSKRSEILSVEAKKGKQGKLVFVTLRHVLSTEAGVAIDEEQDIVYREPPSGPASPPKPEAARHAEWREAFSPDAVTLFRYSALTFNAHRIHYDLPYTVDVESYPGLVVQGPMTATFLLNAFMRHTGNQPETFRFRGQSPLFCDQPVKLCGRAGEAAGTYELWAEGPGGYTAMTAQVTVKST